MSEQDRRRWDDRYASGDYVPRDTPTPFLVEWLPRVPVGRALDVATGTGRNALLLAEAGFDVHAVDGSEVAIERARAESDRRGLDITWEVADLDDLELAPDAYDLVTVVRYRDPGLWPRLAASLSPDGWLLVDHHLLTTADVWGPSDPAFVLEPQELLRAFAALRVVHYEERLVPADGDHTGEFAIARLAACRGDAGF